MGRLEFLFEENAQRIKIRFPLTSPTGNVRVRQRNNYSEYGYQLHKEDPKDNNCYIDWQIEYDTTNNEESHSHTGFVRTLDGKQKYFYCLSDFIEFFFNLGIIPEQELISIRDDLLLKGDDDFIISNPNLLTKQFRGNVQCNPIGISGFTLEPFSTNFPLYFVSLTNDIDIEIGLFEGGFATSSLMPHLYLCIPFSSLINFDELNGRESYRNEAGEYYVDSNNIHTFLDVLHIIGFLTHKHKLDVLDIINTILE